MKNEFLAPSWATPYHNGSFAKLGILRLTQFDKILFLDSDCQVVRNVDHLVTLPTPAFAFHAPDKGLNSGVMVVSPDSKMADLALRLLNEPHLPGGLSRHGGSDQEAWVALFSMRQQHVHELPSGYNFRWGFQMSHEQRCHVHVVHMTSHGLQRQLAAKFQALSCHLARGRTITTFSDEDLSIREHLFGR